MTLDRRPRTDGHVEAPGFFLRSHIRAEHAVEHRDCHEHQPAIHDQPFIGSRTCLTSHASATRSPCPRAARVARRALDLARQDSSMRSTGVSRQDDSDVSRITATRTPILDQLGELLFVPCGRCHGEIGSLAAQLGVVAPVRKAQ